MSIKLPWRLKRLMRAWHDVFLDEFPECPDLFTVYRDLARDPELERRPGGWLYKGKYYPDYLTVGGASQACWPIASRYCIGKGIDLGAGLWPFPGATAVDRWRGAGAGRLLSEIPDGSQDYVYSSHCLEHNAEWKSLLSELYGKLREGGVCFLYLPHPDCAIWHPGSPFVADDHVWIPTLEVVRQFLTDECGAEVVSQDPGPDGMQSFYVCVRRVL
jgi:hypothetical protein